MSDLRLSGEKDRRVHATYTDMDIVRYNRAGKWYLEPRIPGLPRQHVKVKDAVTSALWGYQHSHGIIYPGLPGGTTFDRLVRKSMLE
jgi:hypothetical protein